MADDLLKNRYQIRYLGISCGLLFSVAFTEVFAIELGQSIVQSQIDRPLVVISSLNVDRQINFKNIKVTVDSKSGLALYAKVIDINGEKKLIIRSRDPFVNDIIYNVTIYTPDDTLTKTFYVKLPEKSHSTSDSKIRAIAGKEYVFPQILRHHGGLKLENRIISKESHEKQHSLQSHPPSKPAEKSASKAVPSSKPSSIGIKNQRFVIEQGIETTEALEEKIGPYPEKVPLSLAITELIPLQWEIRFENQNIQKLNHQVVVASHIMTRRQALSLLTSHVRIHIIATNPQPTVVVKN